jgi:hypothetical protein
MPYLAVDNLVDTPIVIDSVLALTAIESVLVSIASINVIIAAAADDDISATHSSYKVITVTAKDNIITILVSQFVNFVAGPYCLINDTEVDTVVAVTTKNDVISRSVVYAIRATVTMNYVVSASVSLK